MTATDSSPPFVQVEGLTARFISPDIDVTVLNGVSFSIEPGKVLCLLGESGSGKSVTLRCLMRLVPRSTQLGGRIRIGDFDVLKMQESELRAFRGRTVSMIFQEPATALDPVFTIGRQISETIRRHLGLGHAAARKRALELLELVQIPSASRRMDAYPHELSGGQRQRAMIAMGLCCNPKLLLADEPTTALDATVQIQILLLLRELQHELGMTTVFVTHDIGVAAEIADNVAVMYAGQIVEWGSVFDVLERPSHSYTQSLLRSVVHPDGRRSSAIARGGTPRSDPETR